jgi:hypothetical protein
MINLNKWICLIVVIVMIIVSSQVLAMENTENNHVRSIVQKSNLGKLASTLLQKDHNICCDCPDGTCYVKCC